jgi:hypothetical protein
MRSLGLTRRAALWCAIGAALGSSACHSASSASPSLGVAAAAISNEPDAPGPVQPLEDASTSGDVDSANWVDCVSALHVVAMRDYGVANAERLADTRPWIDASARVSDLAPADLAAWCDWEACLRTNGYGHVCYVNDAGWEQCRVCDASADCSGFPLSQGDCVAHAGDPGVATCHVVLLEECLLQRAIRLPNDPRVTTTCFLGGQACAGLLPGDLSSQAVAARHETDQVVVEEAEREFVIGLEADAEPAGVGAFWEQQFCMWDGGAPDDLDGGVDGWGEGVEAYWCALDDGGSLDGTLVDARATFVDAGSSE